MCAKHSNSFADILSDNSRISAKLLAGTVSFEVTGTKFGVVEVAEQLLWISTALQSPNDTDSISLNFAETCLKSFTVDKKSTMKEDGLQAIHHIGTARCSVHFRNQPLASNEPKSRGQCWHKLFRQCTIVAGYPIPSRPSQLPGLEIPFDMLAALIDAERVTLFGDNLLLKGFATALTPTLREGDCIFWHMVHNEDGSRISFADCRIPILADLSSAVNQLRPEDVNRTRHIVGWAAEVHKNTGKLT